MFLLHLPSLRHIGYPKDSNSISLDPIRSLFIKKAITGLKRLVSLWVVVGTCEEKKIRLPVIKYITYLKSLQSMNVKSSLSLYLEREMFSILIDPAVKKKYWPKLECQDIFLGYRIPDYYRKQHKLILKEKSNNLFQLLEQSQSNSIIKMYFKVDMQPDMNDTEQAILLNVLEKVKKIKNLESFSCTGFLDLPEISEAVKGLFNVRNLEVLNDVLMEKGPPENMNVVKSCSESFWRMKKVKSLKIGLPNNINITYIPYEIYNNLSQLINLTELEIHFVMSRYLDKKSLTLLSQPLLQLSNIRKLSFDLCGTLISHTGIHQGLTIFENLHKIPSLERFSVTDLVLNAESESTDLIVLYNAIANINGSAVVLCQKSASNFLQTE